MNWFYFNFFDRDSVEAAEKAERVRNATRGLNCVMHEETHGNVQTIQVETDSSIDAFKISLLVGHLAADSGDER